MGSEMNFYKDVVRYLEIKAFLANVYNKIRKSGIFPETNSAELLKILAYMHEKGWLYYGQEDGKVVTIVGAYRIKEFDESKIDELPEEEEGNILFVSLAVSTATDKTLMDKMLNAYTKKYDIKEVIFYERNSDEKIKRFKIGGNDGKEKRAERSGKAEIHTRPVVRT